MAMAGVSKLSANLLAVRRGRRVGISDNTYSDPPEARQFKQWHNDAVVGKDDVSMDIVVAPQLHAPSQELMPSCKNPSIYIITLTVSGVSHPIFIVVKSQKLSAALMRQITA